MCKDFVSQGSYYLMTIDFIPYNPELIPLAQKLRNNSTISECFLWQELKGKRLGYDFERQKPLGEYIVNFYCSELMLAIDIEGHGSGHQSEYNQQRLQEVEKLGVKVIHYTDMQIKRNIRRVVKGLRQRINRM